MNTVRHPAVENTKRSCRKDLFFRYKMPKALPGDVAVRTATFLSSPCEFSGQLLERSSFGKVIFNLVSQKDLLLE